MTYLYPGILTLTYVNIRIAAFTYTHLYLGILTLTCILHMVCKRVFCLINIDIFMFENTNTNWYFYIRYVNELISPFTSAYLYPETLIVTSIYIRHVNILYLLSHLHRHVLYLNQILILEMVFSLLQQWECQFRLGILGIENYKKNPPVISNTLKAKCLYIKKL